MSARAKTPIHLCIVQPPGYVHSMALLDAALYFRHQLRGLGAEVSVAKNRLRHDAVNLIFGAHLGFSSEMIRTFCCVFVNLEQLGDGGSALPAEYLESLRNVPVIDYDAGNVAAYSRDSNGVPLISFGYAPYLGSMAQEAAPLDKRPIDLLFFGSMNPRRKRIIERIERTGRTVAAFDGPVYGPERDAVIVQARAVLNCHYYDSARFEQVRAFQVLSLGTPMVSERMKGINPGSGFEDCVSWFDDDTLEAFFRDEFAGPGFLDRARAQLRRFQSVDPGREYARVIEFARDVYRAGKGFRAAQPCNPQRRLHIGSGKDYRTGWLNVDVLETAQPDVLLDLSLPQTLPLTLESPVWGRVSLRAGASELIYANNVLEHIRDLPTFMTNCLDLLQVGGAMVIEVPYESSLGAWQDPTHVRAMNENSWLYYTDWFWYLGWLAHRFRIRESHWLDVHCKRCEKVSAAFMHVTLEKVQTTIAERMVARTMRADFGGLIEAADFAKYQGAADRNDGDPARDAERSARMPDDARPVLGLSSGTGEDETPRAAVHRGGSAPSAEVLVIGDGHEDLDRTRGPSVLHHLLLGSLKASGIIGRTRFLERERISEIGLAQWLSQIEIECASRRTDLIVFHFPFRWDAEVASVLRSIRARHRIPVLGFATDLRTARTLYNGQLVAVFQRYMDSVDATLAIDTRFPQEIYGDRAFIPGFSSIDQSLFDPRNTSKAIDLSFVGSVAGWTRIGNDARSRHLEFLQGALPGSGVNHRFIDTTGRGAALEEYAGILNQSRMTINFSQTCGGDHHLKGRVFEATASGALLLEESCAETRLCFRPGRDYVEFGSKDDLLEKIIHYHRHPDEMSRIASSGRERARRIFTARNLWTHVFASLGISLPGEPDADYRDFEAVVLGDSCVVS